MSTQMSTISERLREERKRLGLSQGEFADLLSIHRNTQARYERGEREPDTAYLEALRAVHVNVNYVLFGLNEDQIVACPYVAAMAIEPGSVVKPITNAECRDMAAGITLQASGNALGFQKWFDSCQSCSLNPGKAQGRNSAYLSDSDISLLAAVLEGVDGALLTQGQTMHHAKKARCVAMLYRAFRASGKADQAMIEEAVKLAAG